MNSSNISFIIGTYEELVLGYDLLFADEAYSFSTSFTDHSHTASVRSVAFSINGIGASGSADETIKLFDTNKRVEIGSLLHHQGAVTGLSFFNKSHLFSCSDDGTIAIWRVAQWECLRTLKGHRGPVYSFSVHPSGKLALSCGKDKTLRTWNLITGRCAYVTNLKQVAEIVMWSTKGSRYIVVANNVVDVYSSETATVERSLNVVHKIVSAVFLNDILLAIGCEKGYVHMFNICTGENVCSIESNTTRVKSMAVLNMKKDSSMWLTLATSDGFIKVYQINAEEKVCATLIAEHSTGFRLLSIDVYSRDDVMLSVDANSNLDEHLMEDQSEISVSNVEVSKSVAQKSYKKKEKAKRSRQQSPHKKLVPKKESSKSKEKCQTDKTSKSLNRFKRRKTD